MPTAATSRSTARTCARVDPVSLRRRIGYVFQSGGLFPHMSVADNIGITPKLLGPTGGRDCRAGRRTARSGAARAQPIPRPASARAVGRPAPARRRRPGAGGETAHRADGRAIRRARSPHPRCARRRLSRPAPQARADHGHDHPRHDGGDPARRPHRGDARRTAGGAGHAGRACREPATPTSANCCARRGGRPSGSTRCCRGTARHELFSDPRWSEALAHLPDYLGNHVRVSVTALALGLVGQPAAGDRCAQPAR